MGSENTAEAVAKGSGLWDGDSDPEQHVWLAEWLELLPHDRVLFGSDASSPELYYTAAVAHHVRKEHTPAERAYLSALSNAQRAQNRDAELVGKIRSCP